MLLSITPHCYTSLKLHYDAICRTLTLSFEQSKERPNFMKPNIHPDYHEITVIMTDGTHYKTRSCYGQAGSTLRLDVDPKSHPAWTGVMRIIDTGGQVAKFNKRFAGIGTHTGKIS